MTRIGSTAAGGGAERGDRRREEDTSGTQRGGHQSSRDVDEQPWATAKRTDISPPLRRRRRRLLQCEKTKRARKPRTRRCASGSHYLATGHVSETGPGPLSTPPYNSAGSLSQPLELPARISKDCAYFRILQLLTFNSDASHAIFVAHVRRVFSTARGHPFSPSLFSRFLMKRFKLTLTAHGIFYDGTFNGRETTARCHFNIKFGYKSDQTSNQ